MQLLIVIGLVLVISYFVHQLPFNLFLQGGVVSILFSALYFAILRKLKISDEIENMLISKLPFLKTVLGRD
jgi:hypothetical protein